MRNRCRAWTNKAAPAFIEGGFVLQALLEEIFPGTEPVGKTCSLQRQCQRLGPFLAPEFYVAMSRVKLDKCYKYFFFLL